MSEIKYRADFVPQNELHWQEFNPSATGGVGICRARPPPDFTDEG